MTRAALREASFYRRPDVRSVKVYPVAAGRVSACGLMLADNTIDATEVGVGLRCQRPGCKSRWPAEVEVRGASASKPRGTAAILQRAADLLVADECSERPRA